MKIYRIYIIFLLAAGIALQGCTGKKKGSFPDLRETYQSGDSKPFGGEVAYNLVGEIFSNKYVNINKKSFSSFRSETYIDSSSLYISISKRFYCTEEDAEALIDFVNEGHTAMIAASYIDTVLLDKVYCKQTNPEFSFFSELKYSNGSLSLKDTFSYFYYPFTAHFTKLDQTNTKVIGRNQDGKPNLIVLFLGKGRLYLQCDPRAFSNYFLLKGDNYQYLEQVMQFTKERSGNVFWDDYYNKKNYRSNNKGRSALAILFQYPELTMAFWLLILLLLFYILFNGKRKQRIIPIIKPVENTSIAFTQAIAGLYLTEKNNKTIADKMITYFNDHIRNRYFLSTHGSGHDFVQTLSKKSGVSFESVQALYNTIEQVQLSEDVSDFELLTLNEQIQQFYKNRN